MPGPQRSARPLGEPLSPRPQPGARARVIKVNVEAIAIEEEGSAEAFKFIKVKIGENPVCEAIVLTLWDKVKARCPKVQQQGLAFCSPVELVELVFKCNVVQC
jgi:hypothetical protein